ncbi:MAG: hypothetical protein QG641_1169 [Candidatus Poribacteria bacterium]|nr:hypothetical protein [Candidatus Poribacteria bacterium]MDQ1327885.1 hypothetical protein [Candidatus Poribacteria bacterium]
MLWFPKKPENRKVQRYKELREIGRKFIGEIIKVIPKKVIDHAASEMNILVKGILVFDSEEEMSFLFDRIVFDITWDGKSAIEHFEAESKYEPSGDEKKHLDAMKEARFSLFEIVGRNPGISVYLSDLLSGILINNQIELTDLALSETFANGLLLATRIVRIENICMTTGASYPFMPIHKDALVSGIRKLQTAKQSKGKDSVKSREFDVSRNYSLYFYKQHRKLGLDVATSEEWEE